MSEALRGGGEVSLPTEKGWVAPAHTGDPPPRGVCASDSGGPRPTKVRVRSDAVVASKTSVLRMLGSLEEKNTAQTRVADLRHRLNRLHWIDLYYACARS